MGKVFGNPEKKLSKIYLVDFAISVPKVSYIDFEAKLCSSPSSKKIPGSGLFSLELTLGTEI